MIKKIFFCTTVLLLSVKSFSQIRVGLESNSQWYIDDKKVKIDEVDAEERFRSNTYLKFDYSYKNWELGAQLEAYAPKPILNYSPDFKKFDVGTVFARYNNTESGVDVTLGHFYEQFGSGLVLRSWEDRQIGINNAIFGARAKLRMAPGADITFLGGKQRIGMGFDLSDSYLYGANVEVDLAEVTGNEESGFKVGASYVGRYQDQKELYPLLSKTLDLFSGRVDYTGDAFYFGAEYVYKAKDALVENYKVFENIEKDGNALLVNTGFSAEGLGLNVTLRRMENMTFYSERNFAGNIYNKGVGNYVPALTKQYDYSLQNIYVYQAQPGFSYYQNPKLGEIGGQFDFYYNFKKGSTIGGEYGTSVIVNGSYWAGLKLKDADVSKDELLEADYFAMGDKYYSDLGLEIRKKWSSNWSSIFMYLNQYYNKEKVEDTYGLVKTNMVSAETTYQFAGTKSIRLEMQHLWADSDKKNWAGATLEFAANANWGFFVTDIYNYGNDEVDEQIHYYNGGVSYTKGVTRIAASYGRQRGGLLCVGGVCRMVSEAAGLTVGISTSF
ncbi:DUF6029 family protein [Flavobacterium sp. HSC-61S13]|uniref:DUF6029 family protein n=1 Tax=Flavobacterium sp. HSC-61S13 TaxID=2910963 RepID=UPI0020A06186|nr:DUF6029 family protein [Flavobacterium sp. HSC-61S13]MCP1997125.1 hypothetical protein [Flavobacterium sp. HSC-61S13]